jgi:hypothetical protein
MLSLVGGYLTACFAPRELLPANQAAASGLPSMVYITATREQVRKDTAPHVFPQAGRLNHTPAYHPALIANEDADDTLGKVPEHAGLIPMIPGFMVEALVAHDRAVAPAPGFAHIQVGILDSDHDVVAKLICRLLLCTNTNDPLGTGPGRVIIQVMPDLMPKDNSVKIRGRDVASQ